MSVCVNFRTAKQLEPQQIIDELVHRAQKIVITSSEFPRVELGTKQKALCGIEIYQQENGYEVRISTFANRSDLQLYSMAVDVMRDLTSAAALYEDDDEQVIANPKEYFGEKWILEQLEESLKISCALIKHKGCPIIMYGLFFHFCFGPALAKAFDLDLSDPQIEKMHDIQNYLSNMQWYFADKKSTSTKITFKDSTGEDERLLKTSFIYADRGKVEQFDFVSYADVLCIIEPNKGGAFLHMEDFPKILPSKGFTFMDDYQYVLDGELSYETFKQMLDKAKLYQVDDLFYHPTYPGNGYDEKQKTFVLMWNPAISSQKMEDHLNDIPNLLTAKFNWSVYDYKKAKKDDRFVMVRCGEGKTGIVMSGIFDSNPYQAKDWKGKGRKVFYMELKPNFIADPERLENLITTEELQEAIPSFDWHGGHSGRLLSEEQARKLEEMLAAYLPQFCNNIDGEVVNGFSLPEDNNF